MIYQPVQLDPNYVSGPVVMAQQQSVLILGSCPVCRVSAAQLLGAVGGSRESIMS